MKVHVFAATTRGPVQIERITREAAPVSQMCLGRTTSVLPVSPDYDAFVRQPSGVIERALGPFEPGGFRLDASDEIGDGRSWQLSVLVAHALDRAGRLAGPGESAGAILWVTGTVDVDLRVGAVDFVGEKLRATRERFAARAAEGSPPVTLVVPAANLRTPPVTARPASARSWASATPTRSCATWGWSPRPSRPPGRPTARGTSSP